VKSLDEKLDTSFRKSRGTIDIDVDDGWEAEISEGRRVCRKTQTGPRMDPDNLNGRARVSKALAFVAVTSPRLPQFLTQ